MCFCVIVNFCMCIGYMYGFIILFESAYMSVLNLLKDKIWLSSENSGLIFFSEAGVSKICLL